ncbi:hypothetical protein [Streptomyces sp. F-1]|uniref:hypothetical protein n=1 Tax=Streptomyces sp. F-1 TaxID=463642 RepID=UPI00085C3595|nr:hypothetical protein [Streptomyces sp. F-1]SFY53832.1 hypothetical protein STEPF1_07122 [Streptomyces sp. F-1]
MTCRRTITGGGVRRRAWAAVLTLLAALAVLVHHDMSGAPAMSATAVMGTMPGMTHTAPHGGTVEAADGSGRTATGNAAAGHTMADRAMAGHGATAQAVTSGLEHDADGACSGPGMQHCTSGAVGSPQLLAPPALAPHAVPGAPVRGVLAGLGLPGHPHRAPPDLSVLSRLLI